MAGRWWGDISGATVTPGNPVIYPQFFVDKGPTYGIAESDGTGMGTITIPVTPANGGTGSSTQFTQGSVVFAGPAGAYSQNNPRLFWDDSNHRLGVGTATPTVRFEVRGDNAVGEGTPGQLANIWHGSLGSPVTANTPSVQISRREATTVNTGDGTNAGLNVISVGTNISNPPTAVGQSLGIRGDGVQLGTGDAVGGYFSAFQEGGSIGGQSYSGFGVVGYALATTTGSGTWGVNGIVENRTGHDTTYAEYSATPGDQAIGGQLIQLLGHGNGTMAHYIIGNPDLTDPALWDVGIAIQDTVTADIQVNSNAATIFLAASGNHVNGVDFSNVTFSGLAFLSPGFSVAGTGVVTATTATAAQALFRSTGANNASITIDDTAGSRQAVVSFAEAGSFKWQIGKQTDNTFLLYDVVNSKIPMMVSTAGVVTLGENGQLVLPVAGGVGIGATPSSPLTVLSGASVSIISQRSAATGQNGGVQFTTAPSTVDWQIYNAPSSTDLRFYAGGGDKFIFTAAGAAFNATGTWTAISARELKQEIAPYERGLSAVRQLNPVVFRYRPGTQFAKSADEPSDLLIGLMADEVEPHVPEIVGEMTTTLGEKSDVTISTLAPGLLVFALINSVKELSARLEAVEAKL